MNNKIFQAACKEWERKSEKLFPEYFKKKYYAFIILKIARKTSKKMDK